MKAVILIAAALALAPIPAAAIAALPSHPDARIFALAAAAARAEADWDAHSAAVKRGEADESDEGESPRRHASPADEIPYPWRAASVAGSGRCGSRRGGLRYRCHRPKPVGRPRAARDEGMTAPTERAILPPGRRPPLRESMPSKRKPPSRHRRACGRRAGALGLPAGPRRQHAIHPQPQGSRRPRSQSAVPAGNGTDFRRLRLEPKGTSTFPIRGVACFAYCSLRLSAAVGR